MQQFTVNKNDEDVRLDRWFKRHFPNLSTGEVQKACRKGLIRVGGAKAKPDVRLVQGQEITVKYIDLSRSFKPKLEINLPDKVMIETRQWVLYCDDEVLCINKPAGLAVQGGSGLKDHVDARLPALQFDAEEPPKLVHRIDKDTSGVLLLARTTNAAAKYAKLFAGRDVQKTYLALVVGTPTPRSGEIASKMEKLGTGFERMADSEAGKKAITAYRVIDYALDQAAFVELQPITGRTHQLRLHMQQMDCPILGDGKYGGRRAFLEGLDLAKQLHLHAQRLQIPHLGIDVSAPLPKHMKQSMKQLGLELS